MTSSTADLTEAVGADIAVVGAAGKTGRALVAALAGRTQPRQLVRSVRRPGQYRIDLDTGEGMAAGFAGCRSVYFIAPNMHPDEPSLLGRALAAASEAGVDHVVYHSVAWPYSPRMPHHLDKARCEDELRSFASQRGLRWTILQPCAYAQNFESVLTGESEHIVTPYRIESRFSFISLDDVAEVAARVLTEGADVHHGAAYELGGPDALSVRDLVRLIEESTSRSVSVERIGVDAWMARYGQNLGIPGRARLAAMFEFYNERDFLSGSKVTEALLGREPTRVRHLIR
ncbi:SDR family oxidoreductase [Rhodococcus daqingensis]|uniref:SDR family oxidoreductase n=1 Tax=Rhodococcus daqingensis TaxID=2479363 RepID=A0ABW2RW18_9NOCA